MLLTRRLNPYLIFLALTITISAIASSLAHAVTDPGRRALIGTAAALDLTFTVTFLYYWLLVRPGLRGKATMFFVAVLGLWRASFLFPEVVPGKVWIGGGLELAVFAAVGTALWKSRRAGRAGDPLERLTAAFSSLVPVPAAARVMASECAVLYYGFCSWRARPDVPEGAQAFTMHKRTMAGDLFFCMAGVSLLEILPVHLFVNHWSRMAAWILTAVSIYGAIWMMAMARAFTLRPSLVSTEGITVRYGLLFRLWIPAQKIRAVRAANEPPADAMVMPRNTTPLLYIELSEALDAEIVLGLRKRVSAIGISMDDAGGFESAVRTLAGDRSR
jgi:hypothetical protein